MSTRGRAVEGTGLIIRFLNEHHWFDSSRMQYKLNLIMIKNKYLVDLQNKYLKNNLLKLNVGDTIKIGFKIIEGNKERIQFYTGIIIVKRNISVNTVIVVRKVFQGVGIERIFLINSPKIHSIEILKSFKIRRSKLYYLRYLSEKASRLKTI